MFVWIDDKAKYKAVGRWARARVISQNGAIAVLRVNQSKVRRDYDPRHDVPLSRTLDKPEKEVALEPDDDLYFQDFKVFMTKVKAGSFSAPNVSFENSRQILELSTPSCSMTPLLIDYGLDVSNPYDINAVSSVNKLAERLRRMRLSIVLFNLPGVDKKNMKQVLYDISQELHEYIRDTGFILVVLDSMSLPVLTKKSKHKIKKLKDVEEHIFHPGGNSNHYCSMRTNMPQSYAAYPLSQTSDRSKNRLAVFAVKLRESMKAYLSDKDDWPTSYYSELLLDTLLEDLTPAEIKDLDVWYDKHVMQEQVYTVSYKIITDDKFLQNMMRSVDALPARTEANLESVNGRSAEFFKTSVLYARRKLIPRLSFETSVIYRAYGRKIPLSAMDDSCMILCWVKNKRPYQLFVTWVKNKRPYQLFVTSSRDFMDVQRRMPASKISMVTYWSRYLFKNYIDLFQKRFFHQLLRLQCCSRNTSMDATLATASSAHCCAAVDATFMVATCLSRTTSSGRGNFSLRGNFIFRGQLPEPSPASPVVQTLDKDDDEDIAEDQPMPAQPLLPARRPRAPSIADPGAAVEALADVVPVATPVEAPVQVVPAALAIGASSEGAVAPASKKARQYDLQPQQPVQPMQPPLPTSSSSPAALQEPTTTSSPTEPEAKKHKQQHEEDDEDLAMDSFHPLQPTDPPVLPLSEHQPAAAADLEASRSRSRTHSEVSEAPTIQYPDPAPDPPRQSGQEEASLPEQSLPAPDPPSRSSSVAPTDFYSDIAKAYGPVHAQLGDEQDFMFWKKMGKHNLVLWLDYTEEATTYHTLDMSMWGAVRYRRTFSSDDCNLVQSLAIDHKYSPSSYMTKMPIHSGKGFFTEFWYDP